MRTDPSRRGFLRTLAAFSLFPLEEEKPDLILHNGNISTVNAKEPRAQAIAISRGRIIAVGSDADVLRLANAATKKIDLSRKTVLPGFIDAIQPDGTIRRNVNDGDRAGSRIALLFHPIDETFQRLFPYFVAGKFYLKTCAS